MVLKAQFLYKIPKHNHINPYYVMFISNTTVNWLTTADQIFCHNNKYQ